MDRVQVIFNDKIKIYVEKGTNLLKAQRAAGLNPDAPCGGKGKCGKCKVRILNGVQKGEKLACMVSVMEDMKVETIEREKNYRILVGRNERIIKVQPDIYSLPPVEGSKCALAAFDVGTTTIAAYLMDAYDGHLLASGSRLNPQSSYAADVIERCNYDIEQKNGLLRKIVLDSMNELIRELCEKIAINKDDVYGVSFAGNTAMHHLFLGLPTETLVLAPYVPVMLKEQTYIARDYGLNIHPQGILRVLPNIGSFVGADTAACLLAAEYDRIEKLTLMIDIGTNGEIVLGNSERIVACSTAAGPAFEGAKIQFGMRGAAGAIDHVTWENGHLRYSVIGNEEPIGICGSGLIDAAAVMLNMSVMETSGYLNDSPYYLTDKIYITQKDIRELQLAKSAIAAGIDILCDEMGVELENIDKVLVAGAFGNYMRPSGACNIGLIPMALKDKIVPVGNAAGEGARLAILSREEFERVAGIAGTTEFLELALLPEFQNVFIKHLEFPGKTVEV